MGNFEHERLIAEEGAFWGSAAKDRTRLHAPDWQIMQHKPPYHVLYVEQVNALLPTIQPGQRVLEIGCWSGWLSLEMARQGAHVEGVDVADDALHIAREYAAAHPPSGSVSYRHLDVNEATLPSAHYDMVVCVGVLHHLVRVERVLADIRQALKPGGRLVVIDVLATTPFINTLLCGGLFMLLPTTVSYQEKFKHLLNLRGKVFGRMSDSIEAKGLSAFEGLGREHSPETLIPQHFVVKTMTTDNAFAGYIVQQLKLPERAVIVIGRLLAHIDKALIRLGLMRGLNYTLLAEKPTS